MCAAVGTSPDYSSSLLHVIASINRYHDARYLDEGAVQRLHDEALAAFSMAIHDSPQALVPDLVAAYRDFRLVASEPDRERWHERICRTIAIIRAVHPPLFSSRGEKGELVAMQAALGSIDHVHASIQSMLSGLKTVLVDLEEEALDHQRKDTPE